MKFLIAVTLTLLIPSILLAQSKHTLKCEIQGGYMNEVAPKLGQQFQWVLEDVNSAIGEEFNQDMRIMVFATLLNDSRVMVQINVLDPIEIKAPLADFTNIYKLSYKNNDEIYFQTELNDHNYSLKLQCAVNTSWAGL